MERKQYDSRTSQQSRLPTCLTLWVCGEQWVLGVEQTGIKAIRARLGTQGYVWVRIRVVFPRRIVELDIEEREEENLSSGSSGLPHCLCSLVFTAVSMQMPWNALISVFSGARCCQEIFLS